MKMIQGGITAAKGFEAAGVSAEIKYKNRTEYIVFFELKVKK